MKVIVMEALMALHKTLCIIQYKNVARSRVFCRVAKRYIWKILNSLSNFPFQESLQLDSVIFASLLDRTYPYISIHLVSIVSSSNADV